MNGRVHWYYNTLTTRGLALGLAADAAIEEALEELADEVEEYMRLNAPWEDRSGEARSGLVAEYNESGLFKHQIVLYHTVEYGIWLEVRWNGRFAIIQPTLEHFGPRVMGGLEGVLGRA